MAELTDQAGVAEALGRELTTGEEAQLETLVAEAGDLLHGYLGIDYRTETSIPDAVARVAARMVARSFEQTAAAPVIGAEGVTEQAGPFSRTLRFASGTTSGSVWLDAKDKMKLRPYRAGGGFRSVPLETEQTGRFRTYD